MMIKTLDIKILNWIQTLVYFKAECVLDCRDKQKAGLKAVIWNAQNMYRHQVTQAMHHCKSLDARYYHDKASEVALTLLLLDLRIPYIQVKWLDKQNLQSY